MEDTLGTAYEQKLPSYIDLTLHMKALTVIDIAMYI